MTTLKAIIPVAGLGMNLLPVTKAIPKEMLPLVDRPVIEKIVNECANAGIKDIVLVTHASKNAIENHFDTSFELESLLEERAKRQLLAEVQAICPAGVTIMNVRQGQTLGLGHAVSCAHPIVGDAPFVVVLPDVVMDESSADQSKDNLAQLISRFEATGHSQVLVKHRPYEVLPEYSVVECAQPLINAGDSAVITSMVEKPKLTPTEGSDLSAVGRYVLTADAWPILSQILPGAWGRIQLTDAIAELIKHQPVDAVQMTGHNFNCGRKLGYAQAFVSYGLHNPELGAAFKENIKTLLARHSA
ncbi:sugar phosphate nucleotidyltransferase [Pectobacteriaceae bacterium CE70]|uniref:UTP--glucose-1-phosphate uridylyltransferase n=1 Tax=Serratia sp. (strain ATCC 39006) TaxID=104623 RepID=A0A2I5TAB7_SERS3|nr:sugar phosphate nucleotidyltransferase [Serratia sp. ATCC 39006]WJV63865.1 sugar phosphate nucleotidyltransferase [Pectobacteriaceae bacterium C52]WJV68264.1 sugar phosphate nucleotidyltransferase [Pectobacteriaceae bacterium CE70]WJY12195.1 sugar phosphate nucleotidyltransferase [Pectobacteriaceae bacterium C80]AUH01505.1 GalU regulator GalF [Serratia sp. ATCC 39006]AUH05828.1 GalU regulator GalF [Serratia sp. ATCC 39006]